MKLVSALVSVYASLVLFHLPASAENCLDADLLVRNAHIITMDPDHKVATAMAVRDGKILAVSDDKTLAACVSARTKVVDLQERTVAPGLIDVHTHAMEWAKGILRGQIDATFPNVHAITDITQEISRRATALQPGQWILGAGWDDSKLAEHRYITRQDLDSVAPNDPVYLDHVSGHLAAVNSAALKLAGISKETPDPRGGVIERDAAGEPTGILKDTAMSLVTKLLPKDPEDIDIRAAQLISQKAAELGLTTIHDIFLSADEIRGYQEAYHRGWLKIRVQMSPQIASQADADKLAQMGVHTGFGDDFLKFGAAKMFADGGMGARTIAIYPPGVLGEPDNLGVLRWKPEEMQKAHLTAAAAGWQLETHAIGDRAMDEVLDSYAAVTKQLGIKDPRFRIVHAGISTPAIQKRIHALHVVVDGNPPFVYWIGSWFLKYGPERVRWSYPAKSYIDNGITEAAGSDVPVTPISPWWGIWSAVVRKDLQSGQVVAPEECLTVEQALTLYTRNGAYAGFEEDKKGMLSPGKLADFIVVDRDLLTVPPDQLKDVTVLGTYIGGQQIYETPRVWRRAVNDEAKASYDYSVASYRETVLTAFQQVEDNLAALRILEQETGVQATAVEAAQRSLSLSNTRYEGGVTSYLEVITAENAALTDEVTAVNILGRRMANAVLLIEALGGGWDSAGLPQHRSHPRLTGKPEITREQGF